MPQKIDVHGLFIDPETITDLKLRKRISVYYPVFYEVENSKSIFSRFTSTQSYQHILRFDCQKPYGIIMEDAEQPDPASYVVNYKTAALDRLFKGFGRTGKNITGHINELLKIEISGDREYRILQSGRKEKQISIREIPAKVRLLSGQWIDVFSSSPEYDFQGGTPYAVTDVASYALMITTKDNNYVLYGAGVDTSDEEVTSAYNSLVETYNQIQRRRDAGAEIEDKAKKSTLKLPQIDLPVPKIDLPKIKLQSPIAFGKKMNDEETPMVSDTLSTEENKSEFESEL